MVLLVTDAALEELPEWLGPWRGKRRVPPDGATRKFKQTFLFYHVPRYIRHSYDATLKGLADILALPHSKVYQPLLLCF